MPALFAALLHYPVLDRNGRIVASALTSLDCHDLARAGRTYGTAAIFVVHPVAEQRELAQRIIAHWQVGHGRVFDSRRREALELLRVVATLEQAIADATAIAGARPLIVHTSARPVGAVGYHELRARFEHDPECPPLMLLLGTGFGLAPAVLAQCDLALAPILGPAAYNHLSVRAAAGVILDRLRGH